MAKLTESTIVIDRGKPITKFSSFTLSQSIYGHHFFRLTCPAEAVDDKKLTVFNKTQKWMGKSFSIKIDSKAKDGSLQFNGVVTQVQTERYSGAHGDVVISGYSPTIMMESGPHCKTWEKKAVKNIIDDVLHHFHENKLNPSISPLYSDTLPYYVQYKETAWKFLNRLCSNFGEWLLYDGEKLQIGPLKKGEVKKLVYGTDVRRFSMSLEVLPSSKQVMAHDYKNDQVYNSSPTDTESQAGSTTLGKAAHLAGKELYKTNPKVWNNTHLTNKNQLDKQVNIHAAMQCGKNEKFSGASDSVGLILGGKICISGNNMYTDENDKYGEYTIISINHYTDGLGNYSNDFEAVPSSIKYPPVSVHPHPHCETQSAYVTDNNDPQHLGRVRVRFHWMKPSEKTPWIRVTSPHGGGDKGMFFIPEIGEEAIVCFEGDSAVKPFVNGTVYHGKAKTSFANAGNDVKALQTRSGNKMVMNDKDGSVHITDKGGADTMMDGAGNITTNANMNSTLNAGNQSSINVGGKEGAPPQAFVTMDAGGNIVIDGKTSITIRVGGNSITIDANGITTTAGVGDITTSADAGMLSLNSKGDMSTTTTSNLSISAGPSAKISSSDTDII
jgi:type VI secretion system secreted protein VgrG